MAPSNTSYIYGIMFFVAACGAPVDRAPLSEERRFERVEIFEAWQRDDVDAQTRLDAFNTREAEASEAPAEIGQLAQGMSAKASTNYQFGVSTAFARLQLGRTNSLQVGSVPSTRNVTFFIDSADFGAPGTDFNDEIFTYVDQLADSLAPEWTFFEQFSATPTPTWHFRRASCSGGSGSTSIASFSCINTDDLGVNVVEGPGVVGSYRIHSLCAPDIDMADIFNRGLTAGEELRLLRHATGHASLACLGLGGRTDSAASAFASRMLVDVNFSPAVISTGERCRAKSFASGNNAIMSLTTPQCSGD